MAVEDAIFLARLCRKVYVVHRRDELRAAKSLQARLLSLDNVEMVWDSVAKEITGEDKVTLSASLIRDHILNGEIKTANKILGAPYYIKGRVSHGRKVGRGLGFPTANIPIREGRIIPKAGVYSSAVVIGGKIYKAVTNIGSCPTFGEHEIHLESFIIDFSGDLYDREIRVYLLDFLRPERAFASIDELKAQIEYDKNRTITESGDISWQDLGLK